MKIGVSAFAWTANFTEAHLALLPGLHEHELQGFEIPMFDPVQLAAAKIRRAFEANRMECTVASFALTYTFPILNRGLGTAGTFLTYGSICLLGAAFVFIAVPETMGRSLDQIEETQA